MRVELVRRSQHSRLFSLVGMIELIGSIFSQPILAGLFTLGLQWHGRWIGLPYLGLGALIATSGFLLLFVRIPRMTNTRSRFGDDEEA